MKKKEAVKRVTAVILTALLILSLAACNTDSLKEYKKAAEKTEKIIKGHSGGEFSVAMDFNTDGMTEEELKNLNYFKEIKGSFDATFNSDAEKVILRNYLSLGGLGFDYDMYVNGDEMFMKLPVVGKYIKLNEMSSAFAEQKEAVNENFSEKNIISKETAEGMASNWVNLIEKDDVFKGKNIVLTTPDGEVKTTEYTIKLTDEQIKKLSSDCFELIMNDEKLKSFYEELRKNIKSLSDTTFEEQLKKIKDQNKNYKVENFSYTAYVDIDGYIVNENVELSISVDNMGKGSLLGFNYELNTKNWDINKEQSFEFPVLTDDNTIKPEDMKDGETFMFDELFIKKE